MKYYSVSIGLLTVFCHLSLYSWGLNGHRIVAAIAETQLNQDGIQWVRKTLEGGKLQDVSNWADEIRSDDTEWSNSIAPWHIYTMPKDRVITVNHDAAKVWPKNSLDAIYYLTHHLKSSNIKAKESDKTLLKLLVHVVGDVHQPLHVGNGQDKGGNTCQVYWFARGSWYTNLHKIWDSRLIDAQKLSYTEYVDYLSPKHGVLIPDWLNSKPEDWIKESYDFHQSIYPKLKSNAPYTYCDPKLVKGRLDRPVLSYSYQHKVKPILDMRLHQAGIRLGNLINQIAQAKKLKT
ncbi:MAG: S1/P1 nuclease [Pseudomonadota bacterium]|nr:S1/P1 nuclease [Pseudomonadota bacterium]